MTTPIIEQVTLEEANALLHRKHDMLKRYQSSPILGIALLGSSLYNLHTPESDRDVFILTNCANRRDVQVVFNDNADVRVSPRAKFVQELMNSSPPKVDLLRSGQLLLQDERWSTYFNAIRFSPLQYVDTVESHAIDELKRCMLFEGQKSARAFKQLKISLRNMILSHRVREYGNNFRPVFNNTQRAVYYDQVDRLEELRLSGYDRWELLNVMNNMGRQALEWS